MPLSERTIASGGAVTGVLEMNAGTAARIGVRAGDREQAPDVRRLGFRGWSGRSFARDRRHCMRELSP